MGSGFSFLFTETFPAPAPARPSLGDLPESCVASVLEYLDPPEICKLAVLNKAFNGASSADFVWESKLPPNCNSLIERVFGKFEEKFCKKDIYERLCRNNSFDGGNKVWILLHYLVSLSIKTIFLRIQIFVVLNILIICTNFFYTNICAMQRCHIESFNWC